MENLKTNKKNYTITKKNDYTVLVKFYTYYNNGIGYSRNPYNTLIEISTSFNNETLKINRFRRKQEFSYRLLKDENDPLANWQSRERAEEYTSKQAIEKGIKEIKKNIKNLIIELQEARLNPIYLKLKPIADKKIKHYKTDFNYHDCLMIHRNKTRKFLWLIRDTGSFFVSEKHPYHDQIIKNQINNNEHEVYYYNDNNDYKLTHINNTTLNSIYSNMEQYQPEKTI